LLGELSLKEILATGVPVGTLSLLSNNTVGESSVVEDSLVGSSLNDFSQSLLLGNLGGLLSDLSYE
jgi:hypothetical protein